MNAYILTLQPESAGVARLCERLRRHGLCCEIVHGVAGAELKATDYFARIQPYFHATGRWMAPAELGCADAHAQAYRAIAESVEPGAFVFEDDVILGDDALPRLAQLHAYASREAELVYLGGDEGFEDKRRHIRAATVADAPAVHVVCSHDLDLVMRSVGCWISAAAARRLVALHASGAFLADDYEYLRDTGIFSRLLACYLVSHPLDLGQSVIEAERRLRQEQPGPIGFTLRKFLHLWMKTHYLGSVSRRLDRFRARPFGGRDRNEEAR